MAKLHLRRPGALMPCRSCFPSLRPPAASPFQMRSSGAGDAAAWISRLKPARTPQHASDVSLPLRGCENCTLDLPSPPDIVAHAALNNRCAARSSAKRYAPSALCAYGVFFASRNRACQPCASSFLPLACVPIDFFAFSPPVWKKFHSPKVWKFFHNLWKFFHVLKKCGNFSTKVLKFPHAAKVWKNFHTRPKRGKISTRGQSVENFPQFVEKFPHLGG